jgi:predicted RNase H-like nuclease (RuvC/YqgF family)
VTVTLETVNVERDKLSEKLKQAEATLIQAQSEIEKLVNEAAIVKSFWKQAEEDAVAEIETLRESLEVTVEKSDKLKRRLARNRLNFESRLSHSNLSENIGD